MSRNNEMHSKVETIKESIECERKKLDEIILSGNAEEIYMQNIKVDQLIELYIDLAQAQCAQQIFGHRTTGKAGVWYSCLFYKEAILWHQVNYLS